MSQDKFSKSQSDVSLAISVRSRAARRAGSPTIDVGDVPAALSETIYTPHNPSPGGIRKKKVSLTRNQKIRRVKGAERADAVAARTEIKRAKSIGKAKTVKDRAKDWEDVNTTGKTKKKSAESFSVLSQMDVDNESSNMTGLPIRTADGIEAAAGSDIEPPHKTTVRFAVDEKAADDI